jgi:ankyrin repeat protein
MILDKGYDEIFELFIENKVDFNIQNVDGQTPLHYAANKVDFNVRSIDGPTPLRYAANNNYRAVVSRLLKLGVKIDIKDERGDTPLHLAVKKNNADIVRVFITSIMKSTRDIREIVNIQNLNGNTPLHEAMYNKSRDTLQMLLDHQADVNIRNGDGETILHIAARRGLKNFIRKLMCHNADVNVFNHRGYNPLYLALEAEHKQTALLLQHYGAS